MTTNTYNCRKVTVTARKKSQAMIPWACRRRKIDHRISPRGRRVGRGGRYLFTVRGETLIPSFSNSSLAMRSSPHAMRLARQWGVALRGRGSQFEVLVTTDQNLRYQQNLTKRQIAIVVIAGTSW